MDKNGEILEQYTWDVRYVDAPICRDRDTDDDGELDERLYYTQDANFNVTALVSEAGAEVEHYAYDAHGQVTVYDADWTERTSGSLYANVVLYAGYWRDAETGNYHVRGRILQPHLGWLQRDPSGYTAGMSLPEYVAGNPIGRTDPSGLGWLDGWGEAAKALFGCAEPSVQRAFDTNNWDRSLGTANALVSDLTGGWIESVDGFTFNEAERAEANRLAGKIAMILPQSKLKVLKVLCKGRDAAAFLKTLKAALCGDDPLGSLKKAAGGALAGRLMKKVRGGKSKSPKGKAPIPKQGRYEFPDQKDVGKQYVGQSGNMPQRLKRHKETGRLKPGTESTTPVPGGKTTREISEHNRIQELTGGRKAANSPAVSNKRDPVGANRRKKLGIPEPKD